MALVAGMFALAPVEKASTVHTTILSSTQTLRIVAFPSGKTVAATTGASSTTTITLTATAGTPFTLKEMILSFPQTAQPGVTGGGAISAAITSVDGTNPNILATGFSSPCSATAGPGSTNGCPSASIEFISANVTTEVTAQGSLVLTVTQPATGGASITTPIPISGKITVASGAPVTAS